MNDAASFFNPLLYLANAQTLVTGYIFIMFFSGMSFLWLRSVWQNRVPLHFYLIHFFIVTWSGFMYMNLIFKTPLSEFTWYADWVVSTPLIVLALGLTACYEKLQKPKDLLAALMGLQALTIIPGAFAQMAETQSGMLMFYSIGWIAMFGVFYLIWGPFMKIAEQSGPRIYLKYKTLAYFVILFWVTYPLIWILGTPGLKIISDYTTTVMFIVLPILCKSGFGFLDLYLLNKIDQEEQKIQNKKFA